MLVEHVVIVSSYGPACTTADTKDTDGQPHGNSSAAYAMPYQLDTPGNARGMLLINKRGSAATFTIAGATGGLAGSVATM